MLSYALRAAIMYLLAMIMIRLLGKRALGELGALDFVVMTGVGHTVVSVALDKSIPFYEGIIILATLAGLEYITGFLSLKSQRFSHLVAGKPMVLIEDGKIIRENLKKEKFNVDDLLQELRKQGVADVDQVYKGILESCGRFAVILKEEDQPVSRRDLGLTNAARVRIPTAGDLTRGQLLNNQIQDPGPESHLALPAKLDQILEQLAQLDKDLRNLENKVSEGGHYDIIR